MVLSLSWAPIQKWSRQLKKEIRQALFWSVAGFAALGTGVVLMNTFGEETQADKQDACRQMFTVFCVKAHECIGQSEQECVSNMKCPDDIKSTVAQIDKCRNDLLHANCESPPQSCLELE